MIVTDKEEDEVRRRLSDQTQLKSAKRIHFSGLEPDAKKSLVASPATQHMTDGSNSEAFACSVVTRLVVHFEKKADLCSHYGCSTKANSQGDGAPYGRTACLPRSLPNNSITQQADHFEC